MEFKQERQQSPNIAKYSKSDLGLAYEFAKRMYEEFGVFIKALVVFGSASRGEQGKGSDVDILVIVDDVSVKMSAELIEAYRIVTQRIISQVALTLHVTSIKLSSFWEYVRAGDPVGINILRDGVVLIDTGFFEPLQALLYTGRIRPSEESVHTYFSRAPRTMNNSRWHLLQATLDLYWSVIDSAHAVIMKLGEVPPSPEHAADILDRLLVKPGKLDAEYSAIMRKFYDLQKLIVHREVKYVTGREYDQYYAMAQKFVDRMQSLIKQSI